MTRLERLEKLIQFWDVTWDDDPEIEENLDRFVVGKEEPKRWAACTASASSHFIYPVYETKEQAIARCNEYANDDLYAEWPVAVVDLDTGEAFGPAWHTLGYAPVSLASYNIGL